MTRTEPLKMPHPLTYERGPASSELPFGESALLYVTVPALDSGGAPTIALSGACNLEVSAAARYGGRLMAALRAVVIDAETGAVFSAPLVDHESAPLVLSPITSSPAEPATPKEYRGSYFNVDLGAHLFLPPGERDYRVFVWLDELVGPLRRFTLPAHPTRRVRGPSRDEVLAPLVVEGAAPAEALVISLTEGHRARIAVPGAPLGTEEQSPPIVVLAQGARGRQFRSFTSKPLLQIRAARANAISFGLEALGVTRAPGETLHVLAVLGDAIAPLLSVPWE